MHFVPGEVPADRKFLVFALLGIHLAAIPVCLLNFVDNCIEGGLGILYSLLFACIFNPLLLFLFYRGTASPTQPSPDCATTPPTSNSTCLPSPS